MATCSECKNGIPHKANFCWKCGRSKAAHFKNVARKLTLEAKKYPTGSYQHNYLTLDAIRCKLIAKEK